MHQAASSDAAETALAAWEAEHADECVPSRDAGGIFGFDTNVAGDLAPYTAFLRIPAVRDATEDAIEGRGTSITQLMDIVVRRVLDSREDVAKFRTQTQAQYEEVLYPTLMPELEGLEATLSSTLSDYAPTSELVLRWSDPTPSQHPSASGGGTACRRRIRSFDSEDRARPPASVHFHHVAAPLRDGRESRAGQGEGGSSSDGPTLVLGIDEPELYQHPSRQRHLAAVLRRLATGDAQGVAAQTQVLYTTHSPLFIGLDWFDQVRVLRKVSTGNLGPKVTDARAANPRGLRERNSGSSGQDGGGLYRCDLEGSAGLDHDTMDERGLLCRCVVLVEGELTELRSFGLPKLRAWTLTAWASPSFRALARPALTGP